MVPLLCTHDASLIKLGGKFATLLCRVIKMKNPHLTKLDVDFDELEECKIFSIQYNGSDIKPNMMPPSLDVTYQSGNNAAKLITFERKWTDDWGGRWYYASHTSVLIWNIPDGLQTRLLQSDVIKHVSLGLGSKINGFISSSNGMSDNKANVYEVLFTYNPRNNFSKLTVYSHKKKTDSIYVQIAAPGVKQKNNTLSYIRF